MLFPTLDYFLFLPLVAMVYHALSSRGWRVGWLLAASLLFYVAWNPQDTLILLTVAGLAWGAGIVIPGREEPQRGRVAWSVGLLMVAPLLFYKYTGFVLENLRWVWPGAPAPPERHLPIGISFYTFQALAYVIDVRRGEPAERNPARFLSFLLFFPHLVAGPILRASTLLVQLREARTPTRDDVGHGLARLCAGLAKKLLVADVLRIGMVDTVFTDPSRFTGTEVLIALYAYSLQIYCDFSGYTDFAIGSARLFGFGIPENFDRPYQALSVADYWRRWHMTLSSWVRSYVYLPMGGSRGAGWQPYRNTMVTLLILAVWHGADWTFVLYGILHGAAVALNRWWRKSGPGSRRGAEAPPSGWGVAWRLALTLHFVVLARILFRSDGLDNALAVTSALGKLFLEPWSMPRWSHHAWVVFALGWAWHFTPRGWVTRARERFTALPAPAWGFLLVITAWACATWGPGDSLSFIYHDF
jgi:D-alanyl-lipoteichoic acid acyltransferase DltB (MBOAT superfamily)